MGKLYAPTSLMLMGFGPRRDPGHKQLKENSAGFPGSALEIWWSAIITDYLKLNCKVSCAVLGT